MPDSATAPFQYKAAEVGLTPFIVRGVIHDFYGRVRQDPLLAPLFERAIGGDWDHHIEKVCLFWLTATRLGSGYTARDFMPAHMKHRSIGTAEISRWLSLFRETVEERCTPEIGDVLRDIADRMVESIQFGISRRDG
jgi:hemoglobin